jgi:EAL domain-containing protein (putative c-di-GMP-specific phosphodiesterase class I)
MPGISSDVRRLRRAIEHGQLRMEYQPKADMRTGAIVGVEALARWQAPHKGMIPPAEFIPTAERTGKGIKALTEWTIAAAVGLAAAWQAAGHDLRVAVNLSPRSVLDEQLVDKVARILSEYGVPPRLIQLELTETAVFGIADPERVGARLQDLSAIGFELALDDFGTGYSSLARLRDLPIDEIKIDQSFVTAMDRRANDALIVQSVIALAKNLGLRVVAEGVESEAVWRRLSELGCDMAQGNYLSPPLPPSDVIAWVRQWQELYADAHRMAEELLERRSGPSDRRSGQDDRRAEAPRGRFAPAGAARIG